jgi:orotidine-5'-phosphate decarboxylase
MHTPEIMIALDLPGSIHIGPIVDSLPPEISYYKVGLELFCAEGPAVLTPLKQRSMKVFLDLKLHDIPRTVAHAVRSAAAHGVDLITVHATGGKAMMQAAAEAAAEFGASRPRLVAVTTLTSLDAGDLADLGIRRDLGAQARALTRLALDAGIDGVVTSVHEARALRDEFGPGPILVTPGIRMASDEVGDQKRIATPAAAVRAGSSFLVVGRAILGAEDRTAAARAVLADMRSAQT